MWNKVRNGDTTNKEDEDFLLQFIAMNNLIQPSFKHYDFLSS